MKISICILLGGKDSYRSACVESIHSCLQHTSLDVHLFEDGERSAGFPSHSRLFHHSLTVRMPRPPDAIYANRKLDAVAQLIHEVDTDAIVMMDADSVFVRTTGTEKFAEMLKDAEWAMAVQPPVLESEVDEEKLYHHYQTVSLGHLLPTHSPPPFEAFRYFITGFTLGRVSAWKSFLTWCAECGLIHSSFKDGINPIGDQDLMQVWIHQISDTRANVLDPEWHLSPLWEPDFPTKTARIIHLTNYLQGPVNLTASWLHAFRRGFLGQEWTKPSPLHALPARIGFQIIIVTHNSEDVLEACLENLQSLNTCDVVVVDNASTDQSVNIALEAGATVLSLSENKGFAAAVNAGVRMGSLPKICILNPDCLLTHEVLDAAAVHLSNHPETCCSPDFWQDGQVVLGVYQGYTRKKIMVDLLEGLGILLGFCRLIRKTPGFHHPTKTWCLGTCLCVNRDSFNSVSGFDERYFVYMEDVEFGEALSLKGSRCYSLPMTVTHLGARGSDVSRERRIELLNDGRFRYARIHYGFLFQKVCLGVLRVGRLLK